MLWVASLALLLVVVPIVFVLLKGVLDAANSIVPSVQGIATVAAAGSKDLDAVPLLLLGALHHALLPAGRVQQRPLVHLGRRGGHGQRHRQDEHHALHSPRATGWT